MTQRADVVVIGAGAMGSSAAWWLARRGRRVIVLERFEQGHQRGSSHGSTRIFRLAYLERDYVELARQSLPLWRELEDDAGVPLLDTTGGVDHGDARDTDTIAAAMRSTGVDHEVLRAEEAHERWPGLRFDGSVVFQPDAGRARAEATVRAQQDRAVHHGAHISFGAAAELVEAGDGGVVVRSGDEEYRAPVAVLAAGSWTDDVARRFIPRLPRLQVTLEQVFHFPLTQAGRETVWPSFIHYRPFPAVYGLAAPGEGVKVAEHGGGRPTTADARSFDIDAIGRERVCRYVDSWLPGLEPVPASATTCLYTNTPTTDFVVDRYGPLVVAGGFSGHGFKFTPLIGRLIADLVDDQPLTGAARRLALPS